MRGIQSKGNWTVTLQEAKEGHVEAFPACVKTRNNQKGYTHHIKWRKSPTTAKIKYFDNNLEICYNSHHHCSGKKGEKDLQMIPDFS